MARRGENIYKRKDGRWEGRYIKGKNLNNKSLYGYVYGKSYREVKAKLLHQKNTIECRSNAIHSTVQSVAEAWLISIKDKLKHSTYSTNFPQSVYSYIRLLFIIIITKA